ncbi:MAG: V-type ATPase 116kDa subunit family protein [Gaiellaceae bacterium]
MPRPEHTLPVPERMSRVGIVAPGHRLRDVLALIADSGAVEPAGALPAASGDAVEALRRLERQNGAAAAPCVLATRPDVTVLEQEGDVEALAGEVDVLRHVDAATRHGSFAGIVGWAPSSRVAALAERVAPAGGAVVELRPPAGVEPPAAIARTRLARPFRPLVETYAPTRYADLDPTLFAAASFVLMFGMMFGDVGHGLLVAALALLLRRSSHRALAGVRRLWPLPFAAGLSAAAFGLLYGECFGPTGLVPRLWLDPIERPIPLLAAAVANGALLLANSYAIGTVNRWREGGASRALLAPSGIAGTFVFVGGGVAAAGLYLESSLVGVAGGAVAVAGVALLATGYLVQAGRSRLAAVEASFEVVDAVVRVGAATISFTRLAAFGMMHAALGTIVWSATTALTGGALGSLAAAAVFLVGNTLAFALEALVASIQALRLEYYELFSRVFAGEDGHAFAPWHVPLAVREEHRC